MANIYKKEFFSESTNGRMIKVAATSTPGTLIHTATSTANEKDEVYLYATNNHTAAVTIAVEFGGVSSPDDLIRRTIPSKSGLYLIIPGWVLAGGLNVRVFADTTNVISIGGFVNNIFEET